VEFNQPCNIGVLAHDSVSGISRCGLRGVLGEVDAPDEFDLDNFVRFEGEHVLRVDSDMEWDYGGKVVGRKNSGKKERWERIEFNMIT
jgi:hypothetical protein